MKKKQLKRRINELQSDLRGMQATTIENDVDAANAKHALKKLMECIVADTPWNERSQPLTEAISEAYDLLCEVGEY